MPHLFAFAEDMFSHCCEGARDETAAERYKFSFAEENTLKLQ